MFEVMIPQDIELKPSFKKNLLSGITVLEGEALKVEREDWSKKLYRPLTPQKPGKTSIQLIPYFTWANRGVTDMTVWMPLSY